MKKLFLFILSIHATCCLAQTGINAPWTWMKGDMGIDGAGVYGTLGVPSSANKPGARAFGFTWTDASGNFWLMGGYKNLASGDNLNDLWKYEPSANQWTWVNGSNLVNQPGIYGTMGVSSSANRPGGRTGSLTWADASGNLWLFGGYGHSTSANAGILNDLWKYSIASNEWTWVNGDQTLFNLHVFGTQGVASPTNKPGGTNRAGTWVDNNGKFWFFAGFDMDFTNTLWKYDPVTNVWTWVKGVTTGHTYGTYGTRGLAAPANSPGSRANMITWKDAIGDLWLFGGNGQAASAVGYLNDTWKYNIASNNWTWISGDDQRDILGVYGTKGVTSATNKPGGRENHISWKEASGIIWVFGGYGYGDGSSGFPHGPLNDLWKYDPTTNQWTWMKGETITNVGSVFDMLGLPSTFAKPGGREGSHSWFDNTGNLFLLGGRGIGCTGPGCAGHTNDLWKISTNNLNLPTAINSPALEKYFQVFPNPASADLFIRCSGQYGKMRLRMTDISGKELITAVNFTTTAHLDINTYAPGVYIIQVESEMTRERFQKIIVKQ